MTPVFLPTVLRPRGRLTALGMCTMICLCHSLHADESPDGKSTADGKTAAATSTETEPDLKNWIELGIGGVITHGDTAQFEQEHRISDGVFGGIQDMHYEQAVGKNGQLTVDGHALWDNNDYDIKVDLSQPNLGYIRGGFTEYRSWYDGNGGYFPHNGQFFPPPFPEMHIDRGEAWVELGLRLPDWPEITVRYSREFRDGQKDSTSWGDTTLTGLNTSQPARKIAPAYRDIDETRDIFALDATKTIGNTDIGIGMRYEHDNSDDRLQLERGAGQLPPVVAAPGAQRFITQHETNEADLFSGHATTETRFSDSLWFTAAYSYTTMGSDLSGSRIYGTHYNASFSDPIATLGAFDHGFLTLAGTSQLEQHVANVNLMWVPLKNLTILTAFRYTYEDKQSDSVFLDTTTHVDPQVLTKADSFENFNRFAETLEMRYTGFTHWLFYANGEWEEEYGNIHEREMAAGDPPSTGTKNLDLFWQKYATGFNWYPLERLNLSGQYYHKILTYDNETTADGQQLVFQEWNTDDVNLRITWRPHVPTCLGTVALVSRYDFVTSSVMGQWGIPDEKPFLAEHTALIRNHMFTESMTWNPLARLYFQGNFSYVLNQTKTPASHIDLVPNSGPSVLNFRNDYWTVDAGAGYVLDDKTDLRVDYTFYRANDYVNNSKVGLPYGMGATEHTISSTATRQITKNMRLILKYSYFHYVDQPSGGHNNYEAHSIYSGLQIRF